MTKPRAGKSAVEKAGIAIAQAIDPALDKPAAKAIASLGKNSVARTGPIAQRVPFSAAVAAAPLTGAAAVNSGHRFLSAMQCHVAF